MILVVDFGRDVGPPEEGVGEWGAVVEPDTELDQ